MLFDTNRGKRLSGFYLGTVVKHCINTQGACKVFIHGIYPDDMLDQPDSLPDAIQVSPLFGGSWNGNGIFSYPNLGSTVVCSFFNEDQNYPFFIGSILGGDAAYEKYKVAKPNVTQDTVEKGNDAFIHVVSVDKSKIEINESGYIDIVTMDDRENTNHVHMVLDGKGNLIIDTTQQVQITSPNIKMTAGQSFELTSPQIKINAEQSYELNANTIKENVATNADRTALDISLIGSNTINVVTPTANIDTSTGSTTIKGAQHTYFFG